LIAAPEPELNLLALAGDRSYKVRPFTLPFARKQMLL
jgi:hypothetical protein